MISIVPPEGAKRRRRERCQACAKSTNGGRPFCSDHVDLSPYIQSVYLRQAIHEVFLEADRRRVALGKPLDPNGTICREEYARLMGELDEFRDPRTRRSGESDEVVRAAVNALESAGLLVTRWRRAKPSSSSFEVKALRGPLLNGGPDGD